MERDSPDCVELDAACKVLVKSRAVQSLVKKSVGASRFQEAVMTMEAGNLEGGLGTDIHDLLIDSIRNEAKEVWSGVIRQPHEKWSKVVDGVGLRRRFSRDLPGLRL